MKERSALTLPMFPKCMKTNSGTTCSAFKNADALNRSGGLTMNKTSSSRPAGRLSNFLFARHRNASLNAITTLIAAGISLILALVLIYAVSSDPRQRHLSVFGAAPDLQAPDRQHTHHCRHNQLHRRRGMYHVSSLDVQHGRRRRVLPWRAGGRGGGDKFFSPRHLSL